MRQKYCMLSRQKHKNTEQFVDRKIQRQKETETGR